jgi:hypothetical protein
MDKASPDQKNQPCIKLSFEMMVTLVDVFGHPLQQCLDHQLIC